MPIDDRSGYNALRTVERGPYPVSDVRIRAALVADDPAALSTTVELSARSHIMRWSIGKGTATLSMVPASGGAAVAEASVPFELPAAGRACDIECWHVDQTMSLWLNGRLILELPYDAWTPRERIEASFPGVDFESYIVSPVDRLADAPQIAWRFEGSPLSLHRVCIDRDLYYRPNMLLPGNQCPTNGPFIGGIAFGSDLAAPAQLGEGHFLMMGDNSAYSRDGRLWGRPHPLVVQQFGEDAPFVVPRELLLGKAWCVYFPAPLPIRMPNGTDGRSVIPDAGSLRFIR
jgi:hypothetical protein